jgi:hypothetical protein
VGEVMGRDLMGSEWTWFDLTSVYFILNSIQLPIHCSYYFRYCYLLHEWEE